MSEFNNKGLNKTVSEIQYMHIQVWYSHIIHTRYYTVKGGIGLRRGCVIIPTEIITISQVGHDGDYIWLLFNNAGEIWNTLGGTDMRRGYMEDMMSDYWGLLCTEYFGTLW